MSSEPVVDNRTGKTGHHRRPAAREIGDVWVCSTSASGGSRHDRFDTFACSTDLVHWTQWEGEPLVKPSEPYDSTFAHKPWS